VDSIQLPIRPPFNTHLSSAAASRARCCSSTKLLLLLLLPATTPWCLPAIPFSFYFFLASLICVPLRYSHT
jgi:hypothetical protein